MQSLLRLAFPPQCVSCGELVERDFGLCGECWHDTPFTAGLVCDRCGVPLPGRDEGRAEHCDDCLTIARPWHRGRAAMLYKANARKLVLALKHGDRLDLARPAAQWMAGVAGPLVSYESVIVPIPAHRMRLLQRRYNQAAVLGNEIARILNLDTIPDLLTRVRRTPSQDGKSREERFANLAEAIKSTRHAVQRLAGRPVILVDDVMTSGATMAAAADAVHAAGARRVDVLVMARVAKDA
ncbi:MAG: ComF family protein [Rhodobacteraceae bacterium]|nr:ComF family protein [Paracoccaceae bacterium]